MRFERDTEGGNMSIEMQWGRNFITDGLSGKCKSCLDISPQI